jgi:hypothetical protein
MYQFSRAIYREISPLIDEPRSGCAERHAQVLRTCEAAIERLATDRHYFARPARSLFSDIRMFFPMSVQPRVYQVISTYMDCAQDFLVRHPFAGYAVNGKPMQCRATTRKGTACQRMPLPHNGYCPSHQHLAETEDTERLAA